MGETAKITPLGVQTALNQPEQPQDNGKKQLPGESALWFRRYCLYRDLGHKRSLRAAVAKEQETARILKAPEQATNSPKAKAKKGNAATQPAKVVNVPGSWKHACKAYRWPERARAFDAYIIDRMVETTYAHLGDSYANKYKRVQLLDNLIKNAIEQLNNASANNTTHKNYLAYIKEIAALTKQMENEISGLSEIDMKRAISSYGLCIRDEIEKAWHVGETKVTIKA